MKKSLGPTSRREFLGLCSRTSVAGAALLLASCGRDSAQLSCSPNQGENSGLRASLNFIEVSPDPAKACSHCAFYSADQGAPGCGACTILQDRVSGDATCDSWSAHG